MRSFGHEVKPIATQLVKLYVKRGKNDAADAEAMSRPTMLFVPVKWIEAEAALMLVSVRDRLVRNRTLLSNASRGFAAEFGLAAAKGMAHRFRIPRTERASTGQNNILGLDLAKQTFQLHGVRYDGSVTFRKTLSRENVLTFLPVRPIFALLADVRAILLTRVSCF
ncbi:transposase [Rhodoblastus sphagnicola]|nr:transposase [Rhodoblastus sphagnicola]